MAPGIPPRFDALPAEIQSRILSHLDPADFLNVACTCRAWQDTAIREHYRSVSIYYLPNWSYFLDSVSASADRAHLVQHLQWHFGRIGAIWGTNWEGQICLLPPPAQSTTPHPIFDQCRVFEFQPQQTFHDGPGCNRLDSVLAFAAEFCPNVIELVIDYAETPLYHLDTSQVPSQVTALGLHGFSCPPPSLSHLLDVCGSRLTTLHLAIHGMGFHNGVLKYADFEAICLHCPNVEEVFLNFFRVEPCPSGANGQSVLPAASLPRLQSLSLYALERLPAWIFQGTFPRLVSLWLGIPLHSGKRATQDVIDGLQQAQMPALRKFEVHFSSGRDAKAKEFIPTFKDWALRRDVAFNHTTD